MSDESAPVETRAFDPARYLESPEDAADLLSDAVADGDPLYIAAALNAAGPPSAPSGTPPTGRRPVP